MKKVLLYLFALLISTDVVFAKHAGNEMNVMSFNIRMSTKSDGANWWEYRKDLAANVINFYDVDMFGAQEVLHNQLTDLLDRLPGYGYVGVGREDGKTKGEYSPIFYRKDRFSVVKSGNFWLAEDMNAVGKKGWDAACERVATWAIFKDKESGKEFFFLNTHLDHMGQVARHEGASLVLEQVKLLAGNLPVIVTGDFNAVPTDDPIKVLTDEKDPRHLTHTRTLAPLRYGPEWTFHDYGRIPLDERVWIDYIFVKGKIKVLRHGVLAESLGNLYPSDHCPVVSRILVQ
jgi:endonuclease/exonuclease/phosphatase family metal-dependent hydrolase